MNMCRICLETLNLISIFDKSDPAQISQKIMEIANVEISEEDDLPKHICLNCIEKVESLVKFKREILTSDDYFRNHLNLNRSTGMCILNFEAGNEGDESIKIEILGNTDETEMVEVSEHVEGSRSSRNFRSDDFSKHSNRRKKTLSKPGQFDRTIQCTICNKALATRSHLKCHMRVHNGEKPFQCEFCSKSFSAAYNLRVHRRLHTGERPHECEFCGKKFVQSGGLTSHQRLHTGENPYKCTVCGKEFKTSSHLKYHISQHTGEKSHTCSTCGKGFAAKCDLVQHEKIHTGERSYSCCICSMSFIRAYHLERHMLTHTREKRFKCDICDSFFAQKSDAKRHMRTHSKDVSSSS